MKGCEGEIILGYIKDLHSILQQFSISRELLYISVQWNILEYVEQVLISSNAVTIRAACL